MEKSKLKQKSNIKQFSSKTESLSKTKKVAGSNMVETINVNFEDEITSVLDKVEKSKGKKILVSIPSGSDLLVSTVSLELLAEAADKKGKKLVVVTDDESGKTLARSVGITVRGSVSSVDDVAWKEADIATENREEKVKARREKAGEVDESELVPVAAESALDPARYGKDLSEEELPSYTEKSAQVDNTFKAPSEIEVSSGIPGGSGTKKVQVGDFEMDVDSSPLGKSKEDIGMSDQIRPEVLKPSSKSAGKGGFIGRDFSNFELQGLPASEKKDIEGEIKPLKAEKPELIKSQTERPQTPFTPAYKGKKFGFSFLKNIFAGKGKKKILITVSIILLLLLSMGTYAATRYLPEVVVTLEVDSISVDYKGDITADVNERDIDEDDLVVPAKLEEVENNGSNSARTSGKEERGDKASGKILIYNTSIAEEIVLNAGTVVSDGTRNYVTQGSVVIEAVDVPNVIKQGEVDVVAQEIGSEYNISAGTKLSVSSYSLDDVYAVNADSFTGGSSEEYSVVAQSDIDTLVDGLLKSLGKESETELKGKTENSRWVIVDKSLVTELKGKASASAPAGAEADSVDVSVETVSKALYYDGEKLNELVKVLLVEDFDGQIGDIELSDNMDKTITVKSYDIDDGTVVLSVDVSGYVMPQLDDEKITKDLAGKSWTDGVKYLEDMDYVSDKYKVEYLPEWVPEILWRMPESKDRITVKVKNITPELPEGDGGDEEAK